MTLKMSLVCVSGKVSHLSYLDALLEIILSQEALMTKRTWLNASESFETVNSFGAQTIVFAEKCNNSL